MAEDMNDLRTLDVDGSVVAYTDRGSGPAVLLIHAGVFSDWFVPVGSQPALRGCRVIRLERAGYADGPAPREHLGIGDHARHAAALLDHLHLSDVVVVGHSSGSLVAVDLAALRPDLVRAVLVIEPAVGGALAPPEHRAAVLAMASASGPSSPGLAFDAFMTNVCAPDYRSVMVATLGEAGLGRAQRQSEYFFAHEVRAVGEWPFTAEVGRSLRCATVLLVGGASPPVAHHAALTLASWLPMATVETVPDGDHLLPLRRPDLVADRIAAVVALPAR